ncbi:uncharacterized protein YjdB [Kibdelosporangium banguiense]|uniref:Uncharacterized protein YjdB n=1 Tax=Kibdelosporangium banguiense TaxID=1365924 RepID=A0ABS4T957_9PSEU|nr:hypothetical protein [Kibdelosporangium banguiense]MBP2320958.1 uncharacterized protein YjdB [Kibdelosporangium banguiense]
MNRKLLTVLIGFLSALTVLVAPAAAAQGLTEAEAAAELDQRLASGAVSVCYSVHVQDHNWLGTVCDGEEAGAEWPWDKRIEAVMIGVNGGGAGVCYEAHLQDIGWESQKCNLQQAGTVGQARRLEALKVTGSGVTLCYTARGQGYDWQQVPKCQGGVAGSVGAGRYMSGLKIWVA